MSRILHNRPPRTSLRRIGIPDAHDALAVYFRWVRQARYYRAIHLEMLASVTAVAASYHPSPPVAMAETEVVVDVEHDLIGVGAWAAEAGAIEGYPGVLDILG